MAKGSRGVCQLYESCFCVTAMGSFHLWWFGSGCPAEPGAVLHSALNLPIAVLQAAIDGTCHIYARNVIKNWKN